MRNIKRAPIVLILVIAMLLSSVSVFAQEAVQGPIVSPWAIGHVTDSQMMGLLNIEPDLMTKDFTQPVSEEELTMLCDNFKEKLAAVGLENNENFTSSEVEKNATRGSVVLNIFNILAQYDKHVTAETDPIAYLSENKILLGRGSDYKLKEIATLEEAITFFTRAITDIYDDNDIGGKGVFYKVENKENTVYLMGSIHIGDFKMYPLEADRMQAFNESDALYVEINTLDPQIIEEMTAMSMRTDGLTLKDEIGEELYAEYQAIADSLGMDESTYKYAEGWSIINQLSVMPVIMKYPYSPMLGIDTYFMTLANLTQKPIIPLETVEGQIGTIKEFYGSNHDQLLENLRVLIDLFKSEEALNEEVAATENLMNIWNEGREEDLGAMFETEESSKVLTVTRDPEMADKIIEMLESEEPKTFFVLVGAGHYAPKGSVVDILEDAGYTVENLNN